jgi:putative oxygen-independent coproporphyrinogen III oxidase
MSNPAASNIPLSLYIHMPWCVKRCPYCDFNAHTKKGNLPEREYIERLIQDAETHVAQIGRRSIQTVFIGGGTPSLFLPESYERLFGELRQLYHFDANCEITMEANPGAIEHGCFKDYVSAGINRLSLGVQTFCPDKLKQLGRIHNEHDAHKAIHTALESGFNSINIDLMYGLPSQTPEQALEDLKIALSFPIQHLSWYELTLEPNTLFYAQPPPLPKEGVMEEIEQIGLEYIAAQGFDRYEVSAFTQGVPSRHNLNYWTFGDYLGIGAGAHGKLTRNQIITRASKQRHPKSYMDPSISLIQEEHVLSERDAILEFMLNALRLKQGFLVEEFESRTFQSIETVLPILKEAEAKGQLVVQTTPLGFAFVNEILREFLL